MGWCLEVDWKWKWKWGWSSSLVVRGVNARRCVFWLEEAIKSRGLWTVEEDERSVGSQEEKEEGGRGFNYWKLNIVP
jgi:hypothetical protein